MVFHPWEQSYSSTEVFKGQQVGRRMAHRQHGCLTVCRPRASHLHQQFGPLDLCQNPTIPPSAKIKWLDQDHAGSLWQGGEPRTFLLPSPPFLTTVLVFFLYSADFHSERRCTHVCKGCRIWPQEDTRKKFSFGSVLHPLRTTWNNCMHCRAVEK